MELDPNDPYTVDSLSVLFDGDGGGYNNPSALHQPDNLETVSGHVLITEDPGSHNNYVPVTRTGRRLGSGPTTWPEHGSRSPR